MLFGHFIQSHCDFLVIPKSMGVIVVIVSKHRGMFEQRHVSMEPINVANFYECILKVGLINYFYLLKALIVQVFDREV